MTDCSYCKYRINEDDNTQQKCNKWMNKDQINVPCKPEGGQYGDPPNSDSDNCINVNCPSHCQYPFPRDVYNDPASKSEYYGNNQLPDNDRLKDNNELFTDFLEDTTNQSYVKEELRSYNKDNVPDLNLKCGALVTPENEDIINFPNLPTDFELRNAVNTIAEQEKIGTNWGAIKETDKLRESYNDQIDGNAKTVTINDYIIPLSEDGIELEWWNRTYTEEELKQAIPENIRQFQNLNVIHETTGGILQYIFEDHTVQNMVIEEVYDWLRKRRIEVDESIKENLQENEKKFTMARFFGITTDEGTNFEFEECLNRNMMTNHDDVDHLRRINTFNHLSELGSAKNRKDLLYVEAKIIKFITVSPEKISKCFDIIYITDGMCKKGLSSNAIQMLGYFLKLNTDDIENEKYKDNVRVISNRLLKYLPDIIKKIIAIAEYFEDKNCNGELANNTIMLKEIYDNLFVKNNQMSFDYPDLGVIEFFQDFQKNIFTKTVLLIFIAFIITQFISLFNVQYNVNK